MKWVGTVHILAESAEGDRAVAGSKHAVTDGPVVLVPDLLREFVVRYLEVTKQRLGWHGGAVGAVARFWGGRASSNWSIPLVAITIVCKEPSSQWLCPYLSPRFAHSFEFAPGVIS